MKLSQSSLIPVLLTLFGLSFSIFSTMGCMTAYKETVNADSSQQFSRVYFTDRNTTWQAVLESLKNLPLDVTNAESGFIQTKYAENTAQKRFAESFGNYASTYVKAQYRFMISVAAGFYQRKDKHSVKVTVKKEQLIQRDVLEDWRAVDSDTLEENTLLYRIGRIIAIKQRLAKIEEEKAKKALENVQF